MDITKQMQQLLPMGLIGVALLNTIIGCPCGQSHADTATAIQHDPSHVNCPPGSHGKPRWADQGKALMAARLTRPNAFSGPVGKDTLETRSLVRVAGPFHREPDSSALPQ